MRKRVTTNPSSSPKKNMDAQERVVSALWDFAANLQFRPYAGQRSTLVSGPNKGTVVSLEHIGTTLKEIMAAFGCEVTPID